MIENDILKIVVIIQKIKKKRKNDNTLIHLITYSYF